MIENSKTAHQVFGVRNIPWKLFEKSLTRLRPTHNKTNTTQGQTSHISEDIVNVKDSAGVREDTLANTNVNTGDSYTAFIRTGMVKNIAKQGDRLEPSYLSEQTKLQEPRKFKTNYENSR